MCSAEFQQGNFDLRNLNQAVLTNYSVQIWGIMWPQEPLSLRNTPRPQGVTAHADNVSVQFSSSSSLLSHQLPLLNSPSAISSPLGWFWTDRIFHTLHHNLQTRRFFTSGVFKNLHDQALSNQERIKIRYSQNHNLGNNSNSVVQTPWAHNPRWWQVLWQSH